MNTENLLKELTAARADAERLAECLKKLMYGPAVSERIRSEAYLAAFDKADAALSQHAALLKGEEKPEPESTSDWGEIAGSDEYPTGPS